MPAPAEFYSPITVGQWMKNLGRSVDVVAELLIVKSFCESGLVTGPKPFLLLLVIIFADVVLPL
jgi:hypothetical protein